MNEENFTNLAIKISTELASLNTNMTQVLSKISEHDERIRNLENEGKNETEKFSKQISMWLLKGLLIALGIIATLSGSAGIIKQIYQQ